MHSVTKKSEKKKEDMDSEDDSLEEQEDGWAAEDLRGFAQARDAAWEKQVQLKVIWDPAPPHAAYTLPVTRAH
jgi:hypothetical protein